MAKPDVYYAEVHLGDGRIIARMENMHEIPVDWNLPRHTSSDYELHILIGDGAIIRMDHGKLTVGKDHGVIIPPNTAHGSESEWGVLEHFYIHFSVEGTWLKKAMQRAVQQCYEFTLQPDTLSLAHELLQELVGDGIYRQELLETLLPLAVVKAFRDAGIVIQNSRKRNQDEDQERRNLVEVFFRADLPYGKSEERLARELGLSRRQLTRVLMENYGMNFRQMLLKSRMDHAAWMLKATDMSISSIAEKLKYTSLSAFSQSFRVIHGMTPSQYRKTSTG